MCCSLCGLTHGLLLFVVVCHTRCHTQTDNRAFATADDESDDEPAAPPPRASAAAAGGRGGGRGGPAAAAGGGKGPKDAATRQAEFRAKKLQEEAEVG